MTKETFVLGQVVATPGALAALETAGASLSRFLDRHARGDWGEALGEGDRRLNDRAVRDGTRLLSAYALTETVTLWIITEADRSSTCALLPDEY